MTTPNERFRSIRWGHEALTAMQIDPSFSQANRKRAAAISVNYPDDASFRSHLVRENEPIPQAWLAAIDEAGALFRDMRVQVDQGSDDSRHLLKYVDRHFPMHGEALDHANWIQMSKTFGPWVSPDEVKEPPQGVEGKTA